MGIEVVKNPVTRKEMTLVTGKIDGVYFNPLKQIKTYAGPNGDWTPTHSVNIVVDNVRVGFGITDKEALNSKDIDGNYHALDRGMEVSVEITEVSEYQGKPQYSSKASKVTVIDATSAEPMPSGGQQKAAGGFKRDTSGVVAGNGFNAAKALLAGQDVDNKQFVKTAIDLVDIGQHLRTWLAEERTDLDDYSVGAQSGMALIAACEWTDNVDEVMDLAKEALTDILPAITGHVKAVQAEEGKSDPKPAKKAAKKAAKKTTSKKEATPERVDDSNIPVDAYEDDIPF